MRPKTVLAAIGWPFLTSAVVSVVFGFVPDWLHLLDRGVADYAMTSLPDGLDASTSNATLRAFELQPALAMTETLKSLRYGVVTDTTTYTPITAPGWTGTTPVPVLLKTHGVRTYPPDALTLEGIFENRISEGLDASIADAYRSQGVPLHERVLVFVPHDDRRTWPFWIVGATFLFSCLGSVMILREGQTAPRAA